MKHAQEVCRVKHTPKWRHRDVAVILFSVSWLLMILLVTVRMFLEANL